MIFIAAIKYPPNAVDDFDYSSILTQDFNDEWAYTQWTMNALHQCHPVQPEKTVYCGTVRRLSLLSLTVWQDAEFGRAFCSKFSKDVFEGEAQRIATVDTMVKYDESSDFMVLWIIILIPLMICFIYGGPKKRKKKTIKSV